MGLLQCPHAQNGPGGAGGAGERARRGGDAVVAAQQAHRGVLLRVDGGGVGAVRACERRQEGTLLTQDGE